MKTNIKTKQNITNKNMFAGDIAFDIMNHVLLILAFFIAAYPILYVLSASFSSPAAIMSGKVRFLPVEFSLEGYKVLLKYGKVITGFYNSVVYTFFGTFISVALTVCTAYPLSKKDFKPRTVILFIFAFTMWFNGGMIPNYMIVQKLGMLDTRWSILLPGAISFYNMTIVRTYFVSSIPKELNEAATIDGCDDFKYLIKVVLPLSVPILAVVSMYYAVGQWNSYFNAFLYLQSQNLFPLQLVLRDILILNTANDAIGDLALASQREYMAELLKYSLIVVSSIPVIVIYLMVQKHLIKGIMIGAIKG